jgi:hypothetical protein
VLTLPPCLPSASQATKDEGRLVTEWVHLGRGEFHDMDGPVGGLLPWCTAWCAALVYCLVYCPGILPWCTALVYCPGVLPWCAALVCRL